MTAPPSHNMVVTFLGTTSGGGPTDTRNCSSLVLDPLGTGTLWMVDCAEGTVRQFATQPHHGANRVKSGSVNKIFVTHMHADHIMGVITLLRNALGFFRGDPHAPPPVPRPVQTPRVEVYGPAGVRAFIRTMFKLTHNRSSGQYCAHELLNPGETPSAPKDDLDDLHVNEEPGEDFVADEDGCWRGVAEGNIRGNNHRVVVDAGPIHHRAPCLGYVFREELAQSTFTDYMTRAEFTIAPRSVVILGDTSDPTALIPLIAENPRSTVSLLVHEATDAYMPPHIDPNGTTGRNRTEEIVTEKALDKGHSTPAMAGRFARQIGAERLALNHIGARFPAPPQFPRSGRDHFRRACMQELEDQANREWKPLSGERARAVNDFDYIIIPPNQRQYTEKEDIDVLELMQNTVAYESEEAAVAQTSTTVRATHVERKPRWRHGSGEPGSSQRPHQRQPHHNERGGHTRKRDRNDASSGRDSGQGHRRHERGGHRGGHRKARKDDSNVRMG